MPQLTWSNLQLLNSENVNNLEDKPGVYRLSYRSPDNNIYIFFVGEASSSLKNTLLPYLTRSTDNPCIKSYLENLECHFKYTVIEDEELRKNTVHTLYSKYSPKCNLEIPSGNFVEINYK